MKRLIPTTIAACLSLAFAGNALAAAPAAKTLKSGIAVEYIDPAVRVQDDVFDHLNGNWLKTADIPADRSSLGTFAKLRDDTQPQLLAIIEAAAKDAGKAQGSNAQKIGDLYASYMDEVRLDSLGLNPLSAELERVAAMRDQQGVAALMAHFGKLGVTTPYQLVIGQDAKDSSKYVASFAQAGLGMPDRDYYLQDDAKLVATRQAYQQLVAKVLTMAGHRDAANAASDILAFETEMAKAQWNKVDLRDPVKLYNKVDLPKLAQLAPQIDWNTYLQDSGLNARTGYVVVNQPSYLKGLGELLDRTPMATLQAYFQWHLIQTYAGYLSRDYANANFAFYGTTLTGTKEMKPRWKRGVDTVEGALGDALGELYVKQHFPAERKLRMDQLVKNLMLAFKQGIDKLDWMGPATRREAHAKLAKFKAKIGYPNRWRDYSALTVARDDLAGNIMRSHKADFERDIKRLGTPIDRDEWAFPPQTVNAFYSPENNDITFPAAILQAPFFDMAADDAVNYGAIGGVIGHEISHGFDDEGSQYDGNGNLRDWWTAKDRSAFAAKTKMLVDQYSAFSPVPGFNVNGELTLGENIADNSGLAVAYQAYKLSLKGRQAPVINGLTGDQRFFMGWAQVWRVKMREAQQIVILKSDPHAPGKIRANGTLMNQPGFYQAFGVKPGDKMYLPPKARAIIW